MKKALIVVDMQNDFVTGTLGSKQAEAIVPAVAAKVADAVAARTDLFFTRDTHQAHYLDTNEGKHLPVVHCIQGTPGWQLIDVLQPYAAQAVRIFDKPAFGSPSLAAAIAEGHYDEAELIGLCTDICVVSNALLIKAACPELPVKVDSACCAGVTAQSHLAALETMKMCQVDLS